MAIPVITARALADMPALIAREFGYPALHATLRECDLPLELLDDRRFFIPQASLKAFVAAGSRRLGEQDLGLIASPMLSVRDYGIWGDYVLAGATLQDALRRARTALCYHSTYDRVHITPQDSDVRFSYLFAASQGPDYDNISFIALAVMLSIVRGYLGTRWAPPFAELNIKPRRLVSGIEQTFGCQARLGAKEVAFPIPTEALEMRRLHTPAVEPTLDDIRRERRGRPPQGLADVVAESIRIQLLAAQPSLERVAQKLGVEPRTLQRKLERYGVEFRALANQLKTERAKALLAEVDLSISWIAAEMSYSSSANFARAFQRATGLTPSEYRQTCCT